MSMYETYMITLLMLFGDFNILKFKVQSQISSYAGCDCSCDYQNLTSSNSVNNKHKAEVEAERITKDLTVDKTKLSSEYWKKRSVPDNRPTAKGIGCVGVVTLVSVCLVIVFWDVPVFAQMLNVQWKCLPKIKHS